MKLEKLTLSRSYRNQPSYFRGDPDLITSESAFEERKHLMSKINFKIEVKIL